MALLARRVAGDLDPDAGAAEVYPQELTRALLNLISNGFYAATKRKSEADDETFEPVLSATTRSLGSRVEIRIRDNGTEYRPQCKRRYSIPSSRLNLRVKVPDLVFR